MPRISNLGGLRIDGKISLHLEVQCQLRRQMQFSAVKIKDISCDFTVLHNICSDYSENYSDSACTHTHCMHARTHKWWPKKISSLEKFIAVELCKAYNVVASAVSRVP